MVIDTSVILAIIFNEQHATWCVDRLNENSGRLKMSTVNLAEVLILLENRLPKDFRAIREKLERYPIEYVPVSIRHAEIAARTRLKFPLNLGDCFAYALSHESEESLITLDRDFSKTDIEVILPS